MPSAPIRRRSAEGLAIAAEEDVLAVVDQLAGLAIGERRGAAAELAARFEHDHAPAGLRERRRRRQPGDAAADHRYVEDLYEPQIIWNISDIGGMSEIWKSEPRDFRIPAVPDFQISYRPVRAVRAQVVAAIRARCGRGTRMTRLKTS